MKDFAIGDRVELQEDLNRFFGESEHGVIRAFFTEPVGDVTGVHYAEIEWDDGSISSVPMHTLQFEELGDYLVNDFLFDDMEDFEC